MTGKPRHVHVSRSAAGTRAIPALIRECAQPLDDIERAALGPLLDRIADAKVVLLGEASHGTSEFYRMRARVSAELIAQRGFQFVAVEADWPDAARIDDYVLAAPPRSKLEFKPFERFPTWMWRNREVQDFVQWLRAYNAQHPDARVGFHGLDLYSMFLSMGAVLHYLDDSDPELAALARERYGSLLPWRHDPEGYGRAVLVGRYQSAEQPVVALLRDMLARRFELARHDGERFFDAAQNARVVAGAEQYYRAMYYGSVTSWNLRDSHMFDTLRALFEFYGPNAKGIVWAHNSHVGDASATEMGRHGEHNIGQLCRRQFGARSYHIGFGTDHGSVAAAAHWDGPVQTVGVRPALQGSYEALCHEADTPALLLALREPARPALRDELQPERLERAIGVIYRPDTERQSHYFDASLPGQFDEYVWFDETHAVAPLSPRQPSGSAELPDTYPFGL